MDEAVNLVEVATNEMGFRAIGGDRVVFSFPRGAPADSVGVSISSLIFLKAGISTMVNCPEELFEAEFECSTDSTSSTLPSRIQLDFRAWLAEGRSGG